MFYLRLIAVLTYLFYGGVNCAVRRFDDHRPASASDLHPAATVIKLSDLDPRNQGMSSSYSVVQTAGGQTGRNRRRQLKIADDDESPPDDTIANTGPNTFPSDNNEATEHSSSSRIKDAERPKSINEIVDKTQPDAADSSRAGKLTKSDLKKSGSLLKGNLDEDFEGEGGYDDEKHYDKEAGKKFIEAHKSEAAEKDQKGYTKEEGFDRAKDEKHAKEDKKAIVSEKEGEKKGHQEEEKQYGEEYQGKEGEKGISLSKKAGHKKGRKKTGFHKVHHKDEYKTDEVFYDEAHKGEENEEQAREKEKHAKEKGGTAKKISVDSAFHEGQAEKKGVQSKGEKHDEASGHNKEAAKKQQQKKHSQFGKKGGTKEGRKFGYSEGGGSDVLF